MLELDDSYENDKHDFRDIAMERADGLNRNRVWINPTPPTI